MLPLVDGGWIKLNRSIQDSFIWNFDKPQYGLAWVDMLMLANYKDKQILFNGKLQTIKRGSFVTSTVKLAERWHMNRRTVKAFLDVLQSDGMITYECTRHCTTVSIVNYLKYQGFADFEDDSTAQPTAQPSAQPTAQPSAQPTAQPSAHNIRKEEGQEGQEGKELNTLMPGGETPPSRKPVKSSSPVVITITLNDLSEYPITEAHVKEWSELYPAVNIMQELRKMKGWATANPKKRKTKGGILRFINAWLAKEQDNYHGPVETRQAPPQRGGYQNGNVFLDMLNERRGNGDV
jgi:hypothetical protein